MATNRSIKTVIAAIDPGSGPDLSVIWMYRRGENGEWIPLTRQELKKLLGDLSDRHLREFRDMKQQQAFDLQQLAFNQAKEVKRVKAAIDALAGDHD